MLAHHMQLAILEGELNQKRDTGRGYKGEGHVKVNLTYEPQIIK